PPIVPTLRAIAALLLLIVPLIFSIDRYNNYKEQGRPVEVVVVQPNIDPYLEKFGGVEPMEQLDRMLQLAENAITDSTALLIFPETALQENANLDLGRDPPELFGLWENDLERSRSVHRMRAFQQEHNGIPIITGMSSSYLYSPMEERPVSARQIGETPYWYESYNAALFLDHAGRIDRYHKSKLVAGVELMPFEEHLGPLHGVAIDLGGTTGTLGAQEE